MFILSLDFPQIILHLAITLILSPFLLISLIFYVAYAKIKYVFGLSKIKCPHDPHTNQNFDVSTCIFNTYYLTMSDDVDIAIDIWLPSPSGGPWPVVVNAARYYRSCRIWWPFSGHYFFGKKPISFLEQDFIKGFLSDNIAVVLYDVRGSGASFGRNTYPWWPRERADAIEILDWIMNQPFCNKKIGLWGISYSANAAIHSSISAATPSGASINNHLNPGNGVLAAVSLYGFWDVYSDLGYPGGVELECFFQKWHWFTSQLDYHRVWMTGLPAYLFLENVTPVGTAYNSRNITSLIRITDKVRSANTLTKSGKYERRKAKNCHYDNYVPLNDGVVCRDEGSPSTGQKSSQISPGGTYFDLLKKGDIDTSLLPDILFLGGWFDSAAGSAIVAFEQYGKSRYLLLGPWTHGGTQHVMTFGNYENLMIPFSTAELMKNYMGQLLRPTGSAATPISTPPCTLPYGAATSAAAAVAGNTNIAMNLSTPLDSTAAAATAANSNDESGTHTQPSIPPTLHPDDVRITIEDDQTENTPFSATSPPTASATAELVVYLKGNASGREVAASLTSHYRCGYFIMQAEKWCFRHSFPLAAPRHSFALALSPPSSHPTSSSKKHHSLKYCPTAPNPDTLRGYLHTRDVLHRGESAGNSVVTHRVHPMKDQGSVGPSRWLAMTDLMTPVCVDLNHPSLNHLRFTTSPLPCDMEVTGYPTLLLWMSTRHSTDSNGDAGDVFASLQCVEENGHAAQVTEGCLRLKHRHYFVGDSVLLSDAASIEENEKNLLKLENSRLQALQKDSGEPVACHTIPGTPKRSFRSEFLKHGPVGFDSGGSPELVWLVMQPTSFLFKAGQSIRISIYGSDVRHFKPCADKDYDMKFWLGDGNSSATELAFGSRLLLPIVA